MPEFDEGGRYLTIECAPEVMEEVRAAVVDGYFRLVRGGLEVGGLLLGRRDDGTLHVVASRPIPCQHAYGPTFALSDSDLAGLAKLLEASSSEPEWKGLVPVGWYHSHTRSDLELSERDLEVHNRWFPEAWQVALVLRPEWKKPTRAAFYVRDAQGLARQEPEFVVEPLAGVRRTILAPPAVPRVEPRQEATAPPEPAAAPPSPVAAGVPPPTVELPLPSFTQSPVRAAGPSRGWWLLFAVAWSVAGVSSAIALRGYWFPQPPAALQVALQDMGGQLAIQWNKDAPAIQEAEGGVLEIQDGDRKRILKMSGPEIRGASVVVSRQSGRVTVRLEAKLPRGRTTEGWARFEGEPVQRADVEQLQTDLSTQKQRNRDLEAAIATLQKRLAGGP
jgi:proteasome lid subunit RPN8/RPN11